MLLLNLNLIPAGNKQQTLHKDHKFRNKQLLLRQLQIQTGSDAAHASFISTDCRADT